MDPTSSNTLPTMFADDKTDDDTFLFGSPVHENVFALDVDEDDDFTLDSPVPTVDEEDEFMLDSPVHEDDFKDNLFDCPVQAPPVEKRTALDQTEVVVADRLVFVKQPRPVWYQFKDGIIQLVIKTQKSVDLKNKQLLLAYEHKHTFLASDMIEIISSSTRIGNGEESNVVSYNVKVNDVSRNHRNNKFVFVFEADDSQIVSKPFIVRSKKTKRKLPQTRRPSNVVDYKKRARGVLKQLEWRIGGYVSHCTGFVDMQQPIYECPLCKNRRENGHTLMCPILLLLK
jgi:hypothetical protein